MNETKFTKGPLGIDGPSLGGRPDDDGGDCVILGVAVKPELVAAWNNCRRETIEECAAILDENARYFTGIDASVVGALHAGAAEIRALAEDKEA